MNGHADVCNTLLKAGVGAGIAEANTAAPTNVG